MSPRDAGLPQRRLLVLSIVFALLASVVPLIGASAAGEDLTWSVQPGDTTGGVPFSPNIQVHAVNSGGDVNNLPIQIAIQGANPNGATLACTGGLLRSTNASGLATFTNCAIDHAGTYRLRATVPSNSAYAGQNSNSFDVNIGPADHLVFTQYPSAQTPALLVAQPVVAIVDAGGNTVPTAHNAVTLTINKNPGTFVCSGNSTTAIAVNGVATFTGCTQSTVTTGYHLQADTTPNTINNIVGTDFAVTSGPASKVMICWGASLPCNATAPTPVAGGTLWATQPTVRVTDTDGNTVVNDETTVVTLAILTGTPTSGGPGTLTCTGGLSKTVVHGVATFAGCTIDKAGANYQLRATSNPALTAATSSAFTVVAGAATKLSFIGQPPANATAGAAFPTSVQVAITDAGGNVVSAGITATISLSLSSNPAAGAITCTGGNTVATVAGVATFTGCSINNQGNGYTLLASAVATAPVTSLANATSTAINVLAPLASITLTPSSTVITWGDDVTLQVHFATNGAGKTFQLQVSKDNATWNNIATLTTDVNGDASFLYGPSDNRYYRAVFNGTPDLQAGQSPTVRVVVRQIAILRPAATAGYQPISKGKTILFTTTIRPNRPELPQPIAHFVVYQYGAHGWQQVLDRMVPASRSDGVASLQITFNTAGKFYVRSEAVPTPLNANSGWSALDKFIVS